MKIIVGLGNIGEKYANTRHNCGFISVNNLAKSPDWKEQKKLKAFTTKTTIGDEVVLLVKPTTLMNKSGEAIALTLNFFKEKPENLIVIYDDIDLPLGKIRIRDTGSAGTHNGMKSVIEHINTQDFKRIRVGIESRGELTPKQMNISDFVLSKFTEKEIPIINKAIDESIEAVKTLITEK